MGEVGEGGNSNQGTRGDSDLTATLWRRTVDFLRQGRPDSTTGERPVVLQPIARPGPRPLQDAAAQIQGGRGSRAKT